MQNMTNPENDIKQSSAFGLGILSRKMSLEQFKEFFPEIMKIFSSVMQNPLPKAQATSNYATFFDNVVSAFGKCFEVMWLALNDEQKQTYLCQWIVHLPLKSDKKEGYEMNKLLIKLLNSADYLKVYGPNSENFEAVLKNFKKSFGKSVISDEKMD